MSIINLKILILIFNRNNNKEFVKHYQGKIEKNGLQTENLQAATDQRISAKMPNKLTNKADINSNGLSALLTSASNPKPILAFDEVKRIWSSEISAFVSDEKRNSIFLTFESARFETDIPHSFPNK